MFKKSDPHPVQRSEPLPQPASSLPERMSPEARVSATIGSTIRIKGDIAGEESLTIDGTVEGTVTVKEHSLHVGKTGRVNADVFAKTIRIEGHVEGNLRAEEQVLLRSSGTVRGNISSPRLIMEDGCSFKGSVDMEPKHDKKTEAEAARKTGPTPNSGEPVLATNRTVDLAAARGG